MLSPANRMVPAAAVVLVTAAVACAPPSSPPVGVATLAVYPLSVPLGGSAEVTIQFDVAPTVESFEEDYRVFLHVLDANEVFLWGAEHDPPVPTSEWRPGQTIRYARPFQIPPYPYIGPAVIVIGLSSPTSGERLALAGDDVGNHAYRVATFTLEQQHESSFIAYDEGWHQVESDSRTRTEWRWTSGRAVLAIRNPHGAIRLSLQVEGRPDLFDRPQSFALVVGERTLREVTLETNRVVHLEYELTAADLGEDDIVRLELVVDQTFVPNERGAGDDARELGVRVFEARVEPLPESNR